MTWTDAQLSRTGLRTLLSEIPELDEAARLDLVINSISLGGYITELMVHELPKEGSRERSRDALMLLANALGKGLQVEAEINNAINAAAANKGIMPPELVKGMVQLLVGEELEDGLPMADLDGCNILLVEDERDYGERIRNKLRYLGAEVHLTSSGREASRELVRKEHGYNALVADWRLREPEGAIQAHRQGFELFRLCDQRITSRISLTRMDLRSLAVIRNAIPKDKLPDFKVYPKDEVDKYDVVWKLMVQDLQSGARWSERNVKKLMSDRGMVGPARWELWKDYFMRLSSHGFTEFIEPLNAEAKKWWEAIETSLPRTPQARTKSLRSIELPEAVMYASHKASENDSLENMLILRRIVFGLLAWGHDYHVGKVGAPEMDEVTKWVLEKFKAGEDYVKLRKNFLNSKLCIGTNAFGKPSNGLLEDEVTWLNGEELPLDFAETKVIP